MKKLSEYFYFNFEKKSESHNDYDNVLVEIIDDVVKKRKYLHNKYDILFEKLWISNKNLEQRKHFAKKLLGRLFRESNLIFIRAQNLAQRLCPKCANAETSRPLILKNFIKKLDLRKTSLWVRV